MIKSGTSKYISATASQHVSAKASVFLKNTSYNPKPLSFLSAYDLGAVEMIRRRGQALCKTK